MKRLKLLTLFVCCCLAEHASAELVLIANKNAAMNTLNKKQIIDIYMGRSTTLPNGEKVTPLDLEEKSTIKALFYRSIVNKDLSEVNSYWAKLLFSARATPPRTVKSTTELLAEIDKNPSAIGYIDDTEILTDRVKVISHIK